LWKLGRPRGEGGPWKATTVKAGQPSDPYLIWGYQDRSLTLSHTHSDPVKMRVELDLTGTGLWVLHEEVTVKANEPAKLTFPPEVQARWVRVVADQDCQATALLSYR
jgi:hypothetical protein